jgi:hypothetical protein
MNTVKLKDSGVIQKEYVFRRMPVSFDSKFISLELRNIIDPEIDILLDQSVIGKEFDNAPENGQFVALFCLLVLTNDELRCGVQEFVIFPGNRLYG